MKRKQSEKSGGFWDAAGTFNIAAVAAFFGIYGIIQVENWAVDRYYADKLKIAAAPMAIEGAPVADVRTVSLDLDEK